MQTMLKKKVQNADSSSSEDDVCAEALREATDHQFFQQTLFSTKSPKESIISKGTDESLQPKIDLPAKSLRRNANKEEKFDNFGVSASFQKFVAKKLDEILESTIQIKNIKRSHTETAGMDAELHHDFGIKLLSTSTHFVDITEKNIDYVKPKKRGKKEEAKDDTNDELKCNEAAVDPTWVLSKMDTKCWENKRKEPEFKYKKLKNGTLIEST